MRPQPNRFFFVILIFIIFVTGVAAVIASRRVSSSKKNPPPVVAQSRTPVHTGYPDRIHASRLRPQVRVLLGALGSRLSERGKERVTRAGTLTHGSASQPIVVVHEFPNRFSVTGNKGVLVSFDARARAGVSGDAETRALLESVFYDSAESFFIAQWRGAATRFLGARANAVESGDGPVYDIYEVIDEAASRGAGQPTTKRYFFNSDTQLLEIVRYQNERDGQSISVETRFGDWRKIDGQHVPGSVTRLENGRVVLSFANGSTTLGPREPAVIEPPKRNAA
ncbi:MAG TPA: hypothetical protein VJU84_12845 [Pyrinomonadaceae bacterium]|nr:hypothetical protein [Pyrinomonadaceae bacterium]